MANVQFGGLITGLDTNALITGLAKAERRPIDLLEGQKVKYQAQDGVFTALISALGKVKSSAQSLSLANDFNKRSAASSDSAVLTASADAAAEVGTTTIAVDSLAKSKIVRSTSYTSADATIGTGTLTITVGETATSIVVGPTNNTLSGLKSAINASGAAVTASIVNVGASGTPDYRLIVQSKNTGTAEAATISGALAGGSDPFSGDGELVQAASDALFSVNGLTVSRSSNTVSDVLPGVTFVLRKEGDRDGVFESTDATANVTVSADTSAIHSAIKGLAENYNAVNKIVNDQFKYNPETKRQGVLGGDASLRGVMARLRTELTAAGGLGAGIKYISDIGLKFEKDGSLTVDDAKLSSALEKDPTGISNLFSLVQNGIGKRIPDAVDDYISSIDGTLVYRQKGIRTSVENIDKKILREEERIALLQERLNAQFRSLEQMVSQMRSQGDFLSQQMASLK